MFFEGEKRCCCCCYPDFRITKRGEWERQRRKDRKKEDRGNSFPSAPLTLGRGWFRGRPLSTSRSRRRRGRAGIRKVVEGWARGKKGGCFTGAFPKVGRRQVCRMGAAVEEMNSAVCCRLPVGALIGVGGAYTMSVVVQFRTEARSKLAEDRAGATGQRLFRRMD